MFVTPACRASALCGLTILCASLPVQAQPPVQQAPPLCDLTGTTGAVFGSVSDEISQVPLPGVTVIATWEIHQGQEDPASEASAAGPARSGLSGVTSSNGNFAICGVPSRTPLTVEAEVGGYADRQQLEVEPGEVGEVYFEIAFSDQAGGRLVGRITDLRTHRPVSAATIALLSTEGEGEEKSRRQAVSDAQGRFAILDVYPGAYAVTVHHVGYDDVAERVTILARRTVEFTAGLSTDPIELEPIIITAIRNRFLENQGFYDRKDWGERLSQGHFYQRADIERRNPMRIGHLLLDVPSLRCSDGVDIHQNCMIASSRTPGCPYLPIWVDGVQVVQPPRDQQGQLRVPPQPIDEIIHPIEVEAIEVYSTPSEVPAEFAGMNSRCGVIAIWTRRGA